MCFYWTPIAEHEVRLLRRHGPTLSGGLSYDLHTFDHDTAPPYAAISYMCGPPPDDKIIYVNGLSVHVRKNCLDALQQVEQHDECRYIWLDCVCINQVDLDEKSRQVQSMGKIYRRADIVLACIGFGSDVPPVNSLKEAISTLKSLSDFNEPHKTISSQKYRPWLDTLPPDHLKTLTRELNMLGALPYWDRLWIIQEIHLGKAIKLYVGRTFLEWRGVVALHTQMQTKADMGRGSLRVNVSSFLESRNAPWSLDERLHFSGFSCLIDGEDGYKDRTYSFDDALETFKQARCSLPHDRIYGLRELIKWPRTLGAIVPDYNLDPFELAQEAMRYLRVEQCELDGFEDRINLEVATALVVSLGLDPSNALLSREILQMNTAPDISSEKAALADAIDHEQLWHSGLKRCIEHHPSILRPSHLSNLSSDEQGRFVTALGSIGDEHGPFSLLSHLASSTSNSPSDDRDQTQLTPVPLYCGDVIVGWLSQHARSGDCLARIWRDEAEPGLILRPVSNTTIFQIVGMFMLQRGGLVGDLSFLPRNEELILHFDTTDLLVFAAQYCSDRDDDATKARIARTFLRSCNARVTRSAFSSYAVLHRKPETTGNAQIWSNEHGWIRGDRKQY